MQGDDFFQIVSGRMEDADYVKMLRTSTFCLHLRGFQVMRSRHRPSPFQFTLEVPTSDVTAWPPNARVHASPVTNP